MGAQWTLFRFQPCAWLMPDAMARCTPPPAHVACRCIPVPTLAPLAVPTERSVCCYPRRCVCVTFFYINHHNGYDTHRHRPKTRHRTPPGACRSSKPEQHTPRRRSRCMAARGQAREGGGRRNTRGRSMSKQKDVVRAELTGRWGWVAERWAEEERQKWRERSAWRQGPQAGR